MDLSCVKKRMHALLELGVPGCSISIRRDHEELFRYVCGVRDHINKIPMTGEEDFYIFSCTKPITMAATMQLIERGVLSLDMPVYELFPEFKDVKVNENGTLVPAREPITVRHLMTMSAGFDYNIHGAVKNAGYDVESVSTLQFARAAAKHPLRFHPGDKFQYSFCHDVTGAVIEAATGMSFGRYLEENIFKPLGMTHTGFSIETPNLAGQYECKQDTGKLEYIGKSHSYRLNENFESGGAGLSSTLDDYALFADAMACEGVGKTGERILSKASIDAMRENQMGSFVRDASFGCAAGPGYGYGLGVRTLIDKSKGQRSPLGEFGWDGAAGAFIIIDPVNHLSFAFMQHIRNWPRLMGEFYAPIRDEVYEALGI